MKLFTSTWIVPKWLLVCSSFLLIISSKQATACGPDFTGFYCTYLLNHYTSQEKFYPYQLDPNYAFYNDNYFYQENENEERQDPQHDVKYNIAEWKKYLNIKNNDADEALKTVIYGVNKEPKETPFANVKNASTLLTAIITSNKKETLETYFTLLQEYKNNFVISSNDAWSYTSYSNSIPFVDVNNFVSKCKTQFNKTTDDFIKWRYLYLMMRVYHFNKLHTETIDLWQQLAQTLPQDKWLAQYWCEGVYSGALLRTNQMDKSIYYAARQFVNCPDQHMEAMQTYLWSGKKWKTALPYCKTAADTLAVVMIDGLHHPEPDLEHIATIASIDPNAEVLKLLWLRETSKIEQYWINTDENVESAFMFFEDEKNKEIQNVFGSANYFKDYAALSKQLLQQTTNQSVKTTIGNALAYYFYRKKDWATCNYYLQQIESTAKNDIEQQQFLLLKNLLQMEQIGNLNTNQIATVLFSAKQRNRATPHLQHYLIHQEIAPYYLAKKDSITAFWLYALDNSFDYNGIATFNFYNSNCSPEGWNSNGFATYLLTQCFSANTIANLRKQYANKTSSNEIEKAILKIIKFEGGDSLFVQLLAQKYMLAEKWKEAQPLITNCNKEYASKLGPNPANLQVNDCIQNVEGVSENTSIPAIINLMHTLQQKVKAAGNASDKLLYATALYNLSFYGKNHYILDNHWNHNNSSYTAYYASDSFQTSVYLNGVDRDYMPLHASYKNYFYLTTAEKYAKQALPLLTNAEDRAKCTWLLAKCWQKRCPLKLKQQEGGYYSIVSNYEENSFNNPYFNNFNQLYNQTVFYNNVQSNCTYLQIFEKR